MQTQFLPAFWKAAGGPGFLRSRCAVLAPPPQCSQMLEDFVQEEIGACSKVAPSLKASQNMIHID